MRNWFRNALGWLAGEFIVGWLLPIGATAGVAAIGWIQGVPLFYWVIGVALAFASVSVGLLRFSEWRFRNRIDDKLIFENIRVNRNHDVSGFVNELSIGVILRNAALFPIHFRVAEVSTSFDANIPRAADFEQGVAFVPPEGFGWFDDRLIAIHKTTNGVFEGTIRAKIEYGKSERRLTHTLEVSKKLFLRFNSLGDIESVNWYDQH